MLIFDIFRDFLDYFFAKILDEIFHLCYNTFNT